MNTTVLTTIDSRGIATVMLNRPDKHNALNSELINALHETLQQLDGNRTVRALVLTGAGKSFCAGGDLEYMKQMGAASEAENFDDALALARMLRALDEFSRPVIARINGNAFGGGVGLIACADIAIAAIHAKFSLTEVRVGLAAATIAPYVVAALGARQTRRLMLTAASVDAMQAEQLNLIHECTAAEQLDHAVEKQIELLLQGSPSAQQASKALLRDVSAFTTQDRDLIAARTAKTLARLRTADAAREGLSAFLEKRKPDWSH